MLNLGMFRKVVADSRTTWQYLRSKMSAILNLGIFRKVIADSRTTWHHLRPRTEARNGARGAVDVSNDPSQSRLLPDALYPPAS